MRMKKKEGMFHSKRKRSERERERERERIEKWEQKETEGQNKRSERRQREVNDYVARVCWPTRSILLPLLLVPRIKLFPVYISLISSIYSPPTLRSETLFSKWYFVRLHSCAPSKQSSKFSRAARTRENCPYIFSIRPAKLIPPCAPGALYDTKYPEKSARWEIYLRCRTIRYSLLALCVRES